MADVAAASAHALEIFDFPIFGLASECVSAYNRMIDGYEWQGLQNIFMRPLRGHWNGHLARLIGLFVCVTGFIGANNSCRTRNSIEKRESQRKPDYAAYFGTCRPNMDTIMRASPLNR